VIRRLPVVAGLVILAGCVGDRPEPPPAPIAAEFAGNRDGRLSDRELSGWWYAIPDPELHAAVDLALGNAVDLRTALARLDAAAARYGVARGALLPAVGVSVAGERSDPSDRTGNTDAGARTEASGGIEASWELDLWGAVRAARDAGLAEAEAAGFDAADVSRLLVAEVARTAGGAAIFDYRARLAAAMAELQSRRLALSASRAAAGIGLPEEPDQDGAALAARIAAADELTTAATRARLRQRELSGLPATAAIPVLKGLPMVPATAPVGVPADLLRRRPDIRRAERQLVSAAARVGVQEADLYPRLTLTGTVGMAVRRGVGGSAGDAVFWGFGPSIRWRLFEGGAVRAGILAAQADARAAAATWERLVLAAQREVADGMAALDQARREADQRAVEVARLTAAEALAARRVAAGIGDPRSVIDAALARLAAEDRHAQAITKELDAFVALAAACGGGWDIAAAP
jgi:NodT family efflux transporter outer membrane factor (OMF) lipoprotein